MEISQALEEKVKELVKEKKILAAVKLVRIEMKCALKDAMTYVDDIAGKISENNV